MQKLLVNGQSENQPDCGEVSPKGTKCAPNGLDQRFRSASTIHLSLPQNILTELKRLCQGQGAVREYVPLANISSWRVGGPADAIVSPASAKEARRVVQYLASQQVPWLVIGHTTNLLFSDEGVRAVLIQFGERFAKLEIRDQRSEIRSQKSKVGGRRSEVRDQRSEADGTDNPPNVEVEAGAWVPRFAASIGRAGLSGAEHTVGIPGTIGGLICMNGGSMRRGIGEYLVSAQCMNRSGEVFELSQAECHFSYRRSRIQDEGLIVLQAQFRFPEGDRKEITTLMRKILRDRRMKFPRKLPNCGSVFVSNPAMYATYGPPGAVIEKCGLKGKRVGGAEISPLHANFIVNRGNATAKDILSLIHLIRSEAIAKLECELECEVRYVDSRGRITPAHQADLVRCRNA